MGFSHYTPLYIFTGNYVCDRPFPNVVDRHPSTLNTLPLFPHGHFEMVEGSRHTIERLETHPPTAKIGDSHNRDCPATMLDLNPPVLRVSRSS